MAMSPRPATRGLPGSVLNTGRRVLGAMGLPTGGPAVTIGPTGRFESPARTRLRLRLCGPVTDELRHSMKVPSPAGPPLPG